MGTEYYAATRIPYEEVCNDKGTYGEYKAYLSFTGLEFYKRFLFNCYIPKPDGSYTECDLIVLTERGIFFIKVKNRGGTFVGSTTDETWKQYIGNQTYNMFNPIMQNISHKDAFLYLLERIFNKGIIQSDFPRLQLISILCVFLQVMNRHSTSLESCLEVLTYFI